MHGVNDPMTGDSDNTIGVNGLTIGKRPKTDFNRTITFKQTGH